MENNSGRLEKFCAVLLPSIVKRIPYKSVMSLFIIIRNIARYSCLYKWFESPLYREEVETLHFLENDG